MKWHEIIPVFISVIVIVLVAVLEKQSKLVAAVTATMPLTMPLALWIVYAANQGERVAVEKFTQSLLLGILPTVVFALAAWVGARLGLKLGALLALGYAAWGVALLLLLSIKRLWGA
jgi:hypothetical protein